MRIGVIHATNNAVPPLNKAFKGLVSDVEIVNFVDEYIQSYANKINGIDSKINRDFLILARQAEEAEVDIIVVACTVLTPIVNVVKPFIDIPVIAVDHAMLEKAVTNYKKIGLIATNAPTAPATEKQLNKLATKFNKEIDIHIEIDTDAMIELKNGNVEKHNNLNYIAAKKLFDKGCEVIILAQITQTTAEEVISKLGLPVLTSPKEAMEEVKEIMSYYTSAKI